MTLRNRLLLKLQVLRYPWPHGLFAGSFFLGRPGPRERLHRAALLARRQRWPLPVWVVLQAWLALRWRVLHAEAETRKAVALYGAAVEAEEGVAIAEQERIVLGLARRYCIHPADAYSFRLYHQPQRAHDYVHDVETGGMHLLINGTTRLRDHDLLMDKAGFVERMTPMGLPVVPTLARLERADAASLGTLARLAATAPRGVFVKARRGSRAQGAFFVQGGPEVTSLAGQFLDGRPLPAPEAVARALAGICRGDMALVQPRLGTDEALATGSENAAVLRVITRRMPSGGGHEILSAHLRLPVSLPPGLAAPGREEVVLRVEPETGAISRGAASVLALLPETRAIEEATVSRLGPDPGIPSWDAICAASLAGHDAHPRLWAVAWDWLLPPEGPRLLEGNVIWGMRRPQLMEGGMLGVVA